MAYEKKSIRIVAGGLNLSAPSDLIDDSEATELLNFSTDSTGALKSRKGQALRYSVGSRAVQMTKALGKLWIAAGGAVYADGAAVIAGVSSDLCGLVGFRDFLWAMSVAAQRKSDGSADWRWLPVAPTGKPTIKPAAAVETVIDDFTGGWSVDPAGDENYNHTNLQINSQSDTVYTATKAASLDLYTGQSLDDVFRIRIWCKQWAKVEGLTFQIDVNDGNFTKDFYTAEMKRADINAGKKEEVTFYLRKRPLGVDEAAKDKNRYGHFSRIGTTAEKDYRSVVKLRVKVEFNDTTKLRFEEWVLVGDVDNTLEGDDFVAYYTYTTQAGHESNPSDPSDPITVIRTGIDVSAMVASADAQVTGQNVYISGGTLQAVLRVNANTPIAGATYQIRKGDDELLDDDLELENDHDDPPVASGLIGPFYDRLIAFGASKIYWSHQGKPYAFAGPTLLTGDWVAVEEGIGDLLAATMRPGVIFFYGTNGVCVMQGDPGGDSAIHRSAHQGGIQSPQGVCQTPRGDFVNFSKGIYAFNGDSGQVLSKKIERVFKDDGFDLTKAALGYSTDVLWVSDGTLTYKLDLLTQNWFRDSRVFSCFFSDGGALIGVTATGDVLDLDSGATDAGASYPVIYTSKDFDCDLHTDEKRFGDFDLWANTNGATLTVQAILTDPDQTITLGTITSSAEERFVFAFAASGDGLDARRCRIRITGNVTEGCVLHSMTLWYYPKAREGKSFDTGELDLGTHKMKRLLELVLDADNPAAAIVTVKSDRPQPMANRTTLALAATTDRRMQPLVINPDDLIIGRLFRIVPHGDDLRVYGGRLLYQVYGTYIEGSEGEYYFSGAQTLGTERVKLVREAELIYAGAGGTFSFETDLPGNALAVRGSADFPTVPGLQSIKIRFQDGVKGRELAARVTTTGGGRIEVIRLNVKMVGEPAATPWHWVELPMVNTQEAVWADIPFGPDQPG